MRNNYMYLVPVVVPLAGCSNVPRQEDATYYTTHEIVQKVRCEAQAQLNRYIDSHGMRASQDEYIRIKRAILEKDAILLNGIEVKRLIDQHLRPVAAQQVENEALLKEAALTESEIASEIIHLLTQYEKQKEEYEKQKKKNDDKKDEDEKAKAAHDAALHRLWSRIEAAEARRTAAEARRAWLEGTNKTHLEKRAAAAKKAVADAIKTLNGNFTHEQYAALGKKKTTYEAELSRHIERTKPGRDLENFNLTTLSMRFDFDITENNNASTTGSLVWPVALGSVKLNYGAGSDRKRQARRVVKVTDTFFELVDPKNLECEHVDFDPTDANWSAARRYPITGNIGIAQFIEQYLKISATTLVASADKDTYTDTLTFTTKVFGGVQPSVELKPASPNLVQAAADLKADRTDIHEVAVQLKPKEGAKISKPPELNIVGVPKLRIDVRDGIAGSGSSILVK